MSEPGSLFTQEDEGIPLAYTHGGPFEQFLESPSPEPVEAFSAADIISPGPVCICKGPQRAGDFMVGCDDPGCELWLHARCIGIQEKDQHRLVGFMCPGHSGTMFGRALWMEVGQAGELEMQVQDVFGLMGPSAVFDAHGQLKDIKNGDTANVGDRPFISGDTGSTNSNDDEMEVEDDHQDNSGNLLLETGTTDSRSRFNAGGLRFEEDYHGDTSYDIDSGMAKISLVDKMIERDEDFGMYDEEEELE